jgi:Uncharacterized protein conserved in archaea
MLGIVVSRPDDASVNIGEHLLALADWDRLTDTVHPDADGGGVVYRTDGAVLREFEETHLQLERPAEAFDGVDLLVFASKHSGGTGPLLTAHHTGNVGPADHGGDPNEVARACPNAHARVIAALDDHAPDGYEVGAECTHHGPTDVGAPSMFVEVGSSRPEWDDPDAARAVARAILDLRGVAPDREPESQSSDASPDTAADTRGNWWGPLRTPVRADHSRNGWAVGMSPRLGLDALEGPTSENSSQPGPRGEPRSVRARGR